MDQDTLLNVVLVVVFVLVGGVFAATEMALVSLRESQISRLEGQSARGAKVASLARDPNTFLAAVQIGVTVAGFLSAAYGASTLAPDVAPLLTGLGLSEGAADSLALVVMTLLIAYLSLVFGELVPKRFALQRSAGLALAVAPPLSRFATVMKPVIWFLSLSTNAVVRLLGGNPSATNEELSEDELRDMVSTHQGLAQDERRILEDVFDAADRTVKEVMRPRGSVVFLEGVLPVPEAVDRVRTLPHSRYPVTGRDVDHVIGFVHVRDLVTAPRGARSVADVVREIPLLPGTNRVLPSMTQLRRDGQHIALVVDEYGGTDGIVTLEDLVEELVGEIQDEYDLPEPTAADGPADEFPADLTIEEFAERSGLDLPDGAYETVAGWLMKELGKVPDVGDAAAIDDRAVEVVAMDGRRVDRVRVAPVAEGGEPDTT